MMNFEYIFVDHRIGQYSFAFLNHVKSVSVQQVTRVFTFVSNLSSGVQNYAQDAQVNFQFESQTHA